MANSAFEDKNTGGIESDLLAQLTSARRTFTVISDPSDQQEGIANEFEALSEVGIALGDPHPDNSLLICVRYNAVREPDNDGVYRITYTYQSPEVIDFGDGQEEFRQAVNLRFSQVPTKVWRVDDPPSDGLNYNASGDIGGRAIDVKGQLLTSTFKTIAVLDVTMRVAVSIQQSSNYISRLKDFVGKRNKGNFLGADEGQLRYLGATTRRIQDDEYRQLYEVTHSIGYDPAYHQQQTVTPLDGTEFGIQYQVSPGNKYDRRAFPVEWFQPFPQLVSFNGLGINIS